MKSTIHFGLRPVLAIATAAALTACHTAPAPIYQWHNYQPVVYKYFKGESPEEQIAMLEKDLKKIKSDGERVPPGFHAHLGMLYSSVGKYAQSEQEFLTEKSLFPESGPYMDFLLNKATIKDH